MPEIEPFPRPAVSEADLLRLKDEWHQFTLRRRQMSAALKSVMTPIVRRYNFAGSFPRFRRIKPTRYDLLMFAFDKGHDCFVIEIAQCTPDWWRRPFCGYVPPEKLYPHLLEGHERTLIIPSPLLRSFDDCFQYGDAKTPDDYKRLAESFVPYTQKAIAAFDNFANVTKMDDIF